MTTTKSAAINYTLAVLDALLCAVESAGDNGVPGGHLYAFIMGGEPNMTAAQFNDWMKILIEAKKVTKRGEVYFAAKPKQDVCERCGIAKTSGHMCGSCGENV